MPNFVQQYRSTDLNAPVLTGQAGSMIALLDAILVNGYTTASVTGIVEVGTVYTATLAVANTTLVNGNYVTISGGSPGGINGVWGPITVTDSTHITFVGPGGLGTITGTILYRKAPANWTKPFTGTNRAAFSNANCSAPYTVMFLRIEEDGLTAGGQKECVATGFETMTDVNTGGQQFPTSAQIAISGTATKAGVFFRKSATADATARAWVLFADNRFFYLVIDSETSVTFGRCPNAFGSFDSYKASDAFNVCISGNGVPNVVTPSLVACGLLATCLWNVTAAPATGFYVARTFAQTGGSVPCTSQVGGATSAQLGAFTSWGMPFPNGPDSGLWVTPVTLVEFPSSIQHARGRLPGLYCHMHTASPCAEYDTVTNVAGLSGVTLTTIRAINTTINNSVQYVDTFGPW